VFVPLNTRLAPAEVEHCLRDSGTRILVCADGYQKLADAACATCEDILRIAVDEAYEQRLSTGAAEPIDEPVAWQIRA
jgi:fatty-acyl-CoA synthase